MQLIIVYLSVIEKYVLFGFMFIITYPFNWQLLFMKSVLYLNQFVLIIDLSVSHLFHQIDIKTAEYNDH